MPSDDAPSREMSPLLCGLDVLGQYLVSLLAPRDLVALLATCRMLHREEEIATCAFARNETTRHFFKGCLLDWCAPHPRFTFFDSFRCSKRYDERSDDDEEDEEEEWSAEALSPARRLSMLSLAWLMQTELASVLYSDDGASAYTYYTVPFILPLSRLDDIIVQETSSFPSHLACHIQNMTSKHDRAVVTCGFCSAVQRSVKKSKKYEDDFARYCADGKAPELQLLTDSVDYDSLWDVLSEASHIDFWYRDAGFCHRKLQPLMLFFQRHGFGRIVCSKLDREEYENEEIRDNLRHVLMIGAAAPHGFFAGVYVLVQYT